MSSTSLLSVARLPTTSRQVIRQLGNRWPPARPAKSSEDEAASTTTRFQPLLLFSAKERSFVNERVSYAPQAAPAAAKLSPTNRMNSALSAATVALAK
jgi:hypothetical protein